MKTTPAPNAPAGRGNEGDRSPLMSAVLDWDRFWFRPADPTTLGLMRICAGLVVLYIHFAYGLALMSYVGPNAWVWNDPVNQKYRENPNAKDPEHRVPPMPWVRYQILVEKPSSGWENEPVPFEQAEKGQLIWSVYYHLQDPKWIWFVHWSIMTAMFLFTIGLFTRVTSVLTWMGALMYIHRAVSTLFGMDTMMNLALLYLMIAPSGAALSVDRWLKVRRERARLGSAYVPGPPEPLISANFATRLIQINFCIIYLISGFSKLLGASWWGGTAPSRVLLNYSFAPFQVPAYVSVITFMAKHRWLWEIVMSGGVLATIAIEVGFPFLVWNRRLRWVCVCGSILLHTMIGLFMGLVTFSLMMLVLVLSFVPPEVVRQGLQRLGEQLRQMILPRRGAPAKQLAMTR